MSSRHPLISFLQATSPTATHFDLADWDKLIRSARRGYLLSRVAHLLQQANSQDDIPEKVGAHIESGLRVANTQHRNVHWEITQIHRTLGPLDIPFIILKGGAYIMAGCDAGKGRLLSDIDIMVHSDRIEEAERALIENGWFPGKLNAYDQRYYRTWMHELPPLRNIARGTTLDVHHTILPPTAALKPDVNQLWRKAIPLPGIKGAYTLAPVDMILHSATHLFHEGEMEHGLRDLVDIDSLLRQFAITDEFWSELTARALELNLIRPLYYALLCCQDFLGTFVPDHALEQANRNGKPVEPVATWMRYLLNQAIGSILHPDKSAQVSLANFLIFVRSHYLRMPMHLLVPHLLRKMLLPEQHLQ